MHTRLQVPALIATALLIAGCGGSSGSTGSSATNSSIAQSAAVGTKSSPGTVGSGSTSSASVGTRPGKPLSSSQLVAKADAICKQVGAELTAGKDVVRNQEDVIRIAPQRAALQEQAVAELSKLTPPAFIKREYERIISIRRTLAEETATLGRYAAAGDSEGERRVFASSAALEHQLVLDAKPNGFKYCGHLT